ncbi:hypothetical protein CLOM_g1006 [Closterium sp. NIES-68]|nr:hypothetical protein CLOM_g1006 [Closterium sp. NIES-68]
MPYCVVPNHHRHKDGQSSGGDGGSGAAESGERAAGNGSGNGGANSGGNNGGNGGGDGGKVRIFYETYGHGDTKVLMIMGFASGHAAWLFQVKALAGTDTPNSRARQHGAQGEQGDQGEEGEEVEKGDGGEKESGGEERESGEDGWEGSREGNGGGEVEGEGAERKRSSEESGEERELRERRGEDEGGEEVRGGEEGREEMRGGEEGREEMRGGEGGNGRCTGREGEVGERGGEERGEEERGEEGRGGSMWTGREVCIFDNRGVGHSSCPTDPNEYTTEAMAADALFLADHLGWTRFHLVGHSMGGMIACKVAAAASHRIISLGLISVTGGGFDLLPRLDSRVFSIFYRMMSATTPELRAQVDLDTHFSQEYMEEIDAGVARREALHKEYVRVLSVPAAMQTTHGANGHLNACWTHSLSRHDVDEICSAHIPTAVIHGRDDVIAHISLGERVARSLGKVARFFPLLGAHMVLRERAHEVNACLAALIEAAERRVPVEEWVESYRDDRLPVAATWQNEMGQSSSQDSVFPFFQFPSEWVQPEMWTMFRAWT